MRLNTCLAQPVLLVACARSETSIVGCSWRAKIKPNAVFYTSNPNRERFALPCLKFASDKQNQFCSSDCSPLLLKASQKVFARSRTKRKQNQEIAILIGNSGYLATACFNKTKVRQIRKGWEFLCGKKARLPVRITALHTNCERELGSAWKPEATPRPCKGSAVPLALFNQAMSTPPNRLQ